MLLVECIFDMMNILLRIPIWLTLWISGTLSIKYLIAAVLNVRTKNKIPEKLEVNVNNIYLGYR